MACSTKTCDELGWGFGQGDDLELICSSRSEQPLRDCSGFINHASASNFCEDVGARLCTSLELEDGKGFGKGCGYDKKFVWSSTACSLLNDDVNNNGYIVVNYHNSKSECRDKEKEIGTSCCGDTGESCQQFNSDPKLLFPTINPTINNFFNVPTSVPISVPTITSESEISTPTSVPVSVPTITSESDISTPTSVPISVPTYFGTDAEMYIKNAPTYIPTIPLNSIDETMIETTPFITSSSSTQTTTTTTTTTMFKVEYYGGWILGILVGCYGLFLCRHTMFKKYHNSNQYTFDPDLDPRPRISSRRSNNSSHQTKNKLKKNQNNKIMNDDEETGRGGGGKNFFRTSFILRAANGSNYDSNSDLASLLHNNEDDDEYDDEDDDDETSFKFNQI